MTARQSGQPEPPNLVPHASAVVIGESGLLITGAAGSGKSTLTFELIALGAELISDDRVEIRSDGARGLWLSSPPSISGLIEMRGFGLLRLPTRPRAALKLIADLDQAAIERLPERQHRTVSGIACPVILCKGRPGLAASLACLLRAEDWPNPDFLARRRGEDR